MERNLRRSIVNYAELNVNEDREMEVGEVMEEIHSEKSHQEKQTRKRRNSKEELNTTRQFKKQLKNANEKEDWEVVISKTKPKGSELDSSNFVYIILHPGIFRIVVGVISKFLNSEYGIVLKSGKADRYGEAVTKNITYYKFKADGKDNDLMLTFYPTNNALDIKLKGGPDEINRVFADKGYKTAPAFFVTTI